MQGSKISLEVKNKAQKGGYMAENVLKIEYVPIDSINPYPNNAKLHPAEQIEQIKKSIEDFGMNDPIGVWHDEVVEGHGRLIACKELGIDNVPIIRLDDLDDEQRRAYMLVHNQLTMNSGFDAELLQHELNEIADIGMDVYGFDLDFIAEDDIDAGEVEDKTNSKVAVKMVFENVEVWRKNEEAVREFLDKMEKVSLSVGEYNED